MDTPFIVYLSGDKGSAELRKLCAIKDVPIIEKDIREKREHLVRGEVACGAKKFGVAFARHYQRVLDAELPERRLRGFGLRLRQIERLDHEQLAVSSAVGNRQA